MKTNSQHLAAGHRADYEQLQRVIEQQLRNIARRGFTPRPDNAVPQGWFKRVRQILAGGRMS